MKQVVFVHGGESFDTYDEYLAWLKAAEYDPFKVREKKWREWIAESLGEDWHLSAYRMTSPSLGESAPYDRLLFRWSRQ